MVEETLKTVREAEKNADKSMSDADTACKEILSDARQKAADQQKIKVDAAKQAAKKALEEAREKEAAAMEEAKKAVTEETERIRKVALSREKEAIHAIINGLY